LRAILTLNAAKRKDLLFGREAASARAAST